jgi:hypothetical protein
MMSSLLFALSFRRFLSSCRHPVNAQADQLRRILNQATRTEIGQKHGFERLGRIKSARDLVREFQASLPIRSYKQMRADLAAVYAGEWQKLCPSRPLFFSMTAGSTGEFKYIPVTEEFRTELGRGSLIFYGALEAACPALRRLQAQFLVGSAEGGLAPCGIPQGFASGFNYKSLPGIVRSRFVLPYWIFTLDDAVERSYAAGRILVDHPRLGALCAISPVNLINLRNALEVAADRLLGDVRAGTLTVHGTPAVRGEYRTRPKPKLADALRAEWLQTGRLPAHMLFPSLRMLVCWQGGNMSYYLEELDESFGHMHRCEFPISASEGIFAIPLEVDRPGGILAITSHFLEFMPEDAPPGSAALRADELNIGNHYQVIVTNSGGLYRYDMEDVVRVSSFYKDTPVIEFVSKKERQVSVANERVTELDVTVAMQAASHACSAWFREFLFVPCSDKRYRVLIDGTVLDTFRGAEGDERMRIFARELEGRLRTAAKGYDFERDDALLESLQLVMTRPGELREYLSRRQGHQRLPNAQIKPMHLTNEFDLHTRFHPLKTYAAQCP